MPLLECQVDGKSGFKYGASGHCYPHDGTPAGIKAAKKAAIKQAIAVGGGKAPKDLAAAGEFVRELLGDDATLEECVELGQFAAEAERELASLDSVETLPTVNLKGVEILAVGGPYFGQGSPAGGDHFDAKYLKRLATATALLMTRKELRAPNKVGHTRAQKLLEASGEKAIAADEKPAAGWLSNVRFDAKSGKVLADVNRVPRKLARLLKVGAYRTRSVEIQTLTSQTDQKKYRVITGLAWLGERAPAVRTLDDIVALYGGEALEPATEAEFVVAVTDLADAPEEDAEVAAALAAYDEADDPEVELASGDVVWKPEEGYQFVRDQVNAALNPGVGMSRYWVRDVAAGKALVTEYNGGESTAYVVPFTKADGEVVLAPGSEWTKVEQAWVDASPANAAAVSAEAMTAFVLDAIQAGALDVGEVERVLAEAADTSGEMADKPKNESEAVELTDDQVESLAKTFSIDETDAAKRRDAVTAKLAEFAPKPEPPKVEPVKPAEGVALSEADLEALRVKAERGDKVYAERREEKRADAITSALKDGRIEPAKKDFWERQFEELDDDARVIALLEELPRNEEFAAVYGSELDPTTPEGGAAADDAAYAALMDGLGYRRDELPSLAGRGA